MAVERDQKKISGLHNYELDAAQRSRGIDPYPESRSNAYLSKEQLQDRVAHGSPIDSFSAYNTIANDVKRQPHNEK